MKKILGRSWSLRRVALALSVLALAGCNATAEELEAHLNEYYVIPGKLCEAEGLSPIFDVYSGSRFGPHLHVTGCK